MVHYFITLKKLNEVKKEMKDLEDKESEYSGKIQESGKFIKELEEKQEIIKKEIEKLKSKNFEMISALKNLQEMLKEKNDIIVNCDLIEVITVDDERNSLLSNGFVDVNRDILMKLVKLIRDHEKIKNIIGMTNVFFEWSKLPIFLWARELALLPVKPPQGVVYSKNKCIFKFTYDYTVSLDSNLFFGGIFSLNMISKGATKTGLALKKLFPALHSKNWYGTRGTATIYCNEISTGRACNGAFLWNWKSPCTSLTLELDTTIGVLHLFVDGKQLAHAITDIPVSEGVRFVLGRSSGYMNVEVSSLEVTSLHAVAKTCADARIICKEHKW